MLRLNKTFRLLWAILCDFSSANKHRSRYIVDSSHIGLVLLDSYCFVCHTDYEKEQRYRNEWNDYGPDDNFANSDDDFVKEPDNGRFYEPTKRQYSEETDYGYNEPVGRERTENELGAENVDNEGNVEHATESQDPDEYRSESFGEEGMDKKQKGEKTTMNAGTRDLHPKGSDKLNLLSVSDSCGILCFY